MILFFWFEDSADQQTQPVSGDKPIDTSEPGPSLNGDTNVDQNKKDESPEQPVQNSDNSQSSPQTGGESKQIGTKPSTTAANAKKAQKNPYAAFASKKSPPKQANKPANQSSPAKQNTPAKKPNPLESKLAPQKKPTTLPKSTASSKPDKSPLAKPAPKPSPFQKKPAPQQKPANQVKGPATKPAVQGKPDQAPVKPGELPKPGTKSTPAAKQPVKPGTTNNDKTSKLGDSNKEALSEGKSAGKPEEPKDDKSPNSTSQPKPYPSITQPSGEIATQNGTPSEPNDSDEPYKHSPRTNKADAVKQQSPRNNNAESYKHSPRNTIPLPKKAEPEPKNEPPKPKKMTQQQLDSIARLTAGKKADVKLDLGSSLPPPKERPKFERKKPDPKPNPPKKIAPKPSPAKATPKQPTKAQPKPSADKSAEKKTNSPAKQSDADVFSPDGQIMPTQLRGNNSRAFSGASGRLRTPETAKGTRIPTSEASKLIPEKVEEKTEKPNPENKSTTQPDEKLEGKVESKPAESKFGESKPAKSKPAESEPAESNPAESKPAESKSAEIKATGSPKDPKPQADAKEPVGDKPQESAKPQSEINPDTSKKPEDVKPTTDKKEKKSPRKEKKDQKLKEGENPNDKVSEDTKKSDPVVSESKPDTSPNTKLPPVEQEPTISEKAAAPAQPAPQDLATKLPVVPVETKPSPADVLPEASTAFPAVDSATKLDGVGSKDDTNVTKPSTEEKPVKPQEISPRDEIKPPGEKLTPNTTPRGKAQPPIKPRAKPAEDRVIDPALARKKASDDARNRVIEENKRKEAIAEAKRKAEK